MSKTIVVNIIVILDSVVFAVSHYHSRANFTVSGVCGSPGEPISAQNDFDNRSGFKTGDIVSYECVDFLSFKQKRVCMSGHWSRPEARCGHSAANDLKGIAVKKCSDDGLILDYNDLTLEKNSDRFVNSFSSDRYNKEPIRVSGGTCHRWYLTLTDATYFSFIRVDFATVFESVSKAMKEVPVVTAFVERDHQLIQCSNEAMKAYKYVFTNKWISYGHKYHYYFKCQTNNETTPSTKLYLRTTTNAFLTIDLIRFAVAQVYGSPDDPACGKPEVPIGVTLEEIKEFQSYSVKCSSDFINTSQVERTLLKCSSDGLWVGDYPKCKPRNSCVKSDTFESHSKASAIPLSVENVFNYNQTLWYAINGTVVNYRCIGKDSHTYVESKVCLSSGLWDTESICIDNEVNSEEINKSEATAQPSIGRHSIDAKHLMPVYAMVAFTSFIVIVVAIAALVLLRRRSRDKCEINKSSIDGNPVNADVDGNKEQTDDAKQKWRYDQTQSLFQTEVHYQTAATDHLYDELPNRTKAVSVLYADTAQQNLIPEPIYDRPKPRHLDG